MLTTAEKCRVGDIVLYEGELFKIIECRAKTPLKRIERLVKKQGDRYVHDTYGKDRLVPHDTPVMVLEPPRRKPGIFFYSEEPFTIEQALDTYHNSTTDDTMITIEWVEFDYPNWLMNDEDIAALGHSQFLLQECMPGDVATFDELYTKVHKL